MRRSTHVMMQSAQTKLGLWKDAPVGELSTWANAFEIPKPSPETCGGCDAPGCTAGCQCGFERLDLGARYAVSSQTTQYYVIVLLLHSHIYLHE